MRQLLLDTIKIEINPLLFSPIGVLNFPRRRHMAPLRYNQETPQSAMRVPSKYQFTL